MIASEAITLRSLRPAVMGAVLSATLLGGATSIAPAADWRLFRDEDSGIEFTYPALYSLTESRHPNGRLRSIGLEFVGKLIIQVKISGQDHPLSSPPPWLPSPSSRPSSAPALAVEIALWDCRVQSMPGLVGAQERLLSSTHCTLASDAGFTTSRGLKGSALYLTQKFESSDGAKVQTRQKGPIYAFNIPIAQSVQVMLLSLTEAGEKAQRHREYLEAIARTVFVSTKPGPKKDGP